MKNKFLMEQFLHVDAYMHRYQAFHFRDRGPFGNPHRGQGRVLSILKMQPEISQKELGFLLDMRNQSLGELLGKLEKNGYITRTPSQQDKRMMLIKLTQTGREAAEKVNQDNEGSFKIFDCLSGEEKEALSHMLEKIIQAMEEELAALDKGGHRGFNWGRLRREDRPMGRSHPMGGGHPMGFGGRHHDHGPHNHGSREHGPHGPGGPCDREEFFGEMFFNGGPDHPMNGEPPFKEENNEDDRKN